MQCSTCGSENRVGAKFCNECATPLPLLCPTCGAENRPGAKFCDECATPLTRQSSVQRPKPESPKSESPQPTISLLPPLAQGGPQAGGNPQSPLSYTPAHLAERILAEQAALEARAIPDGERKTITALFADIKGSMDLIEGLDPEDARHVVDPALKLMMDAVHRYEGYVAQSTGDGIFALFGAPIAHEDHPQRALYAALRMQEESRQYAETLRREKGLNLQIRVGLNTGEVVLRSIRKDDLHTDYTPIGHSTSLAARMEGLATPGSIVVSEHTQRLADGYFEFNPLGPTRVKGVSEPIHVYEVVGVGPLRSRLQQAARRGLARFVGRQYERDHMQRASDRAREGRGQVVAVIGEPGVGKSRLFHEFVGATHASPLQDCLVLQAFSVAHNKTYPYLPLIELLRSYFQILPQEEERQVREKVESKVLALDRKLEDTLPYLFSLLGLAESNMLLSQMDPQVRRRRLVDAVKRLLIRESLNQPLLCIFEDLQWIDNDTQTFLDALSDSVATAHILLLVNYRPEYRHGWSNKPYYTQLRLAPLGQEEAKELLSALLEDGVGAALAVFPSAPSQPLPAQSEEDIPYVPLPIDVTPFQKLILEKTQGNPFFIEELTQALFAQGVLVHDGAVSLTTTAAEVHIPPTVQGVLASRIDQLAAEEKEFLQTLAVVGKEFPLSLVQRVTNKPEEHVQQLLARVQAAEFIYEQPAFPEPEYMFKHALTQDVAYHSLLMERRSALHERTAQAIEELYRERLVDYYRDLAHHYGRSGNTEKTIEYLQYAGQQAAQRLAYTEAIGHLTSALALLKSQPNTPAHVRQELAMQTTLGALVMLTRGWADPEAEQAYTRARALCRQIGETPQLFPVLRGLWVFYLARAELHIARELGTQLLTLAQSAQDSTLLTEAHYTLGATAFWLGEPVRAREHLEQAITLYDAQSARAHMVAGLDIGVLCKSLMPLTLWLLGYPDQALQWSREAMALTEALSFPFSSAFAFFVASMFHQLCGERDTVQERAEAAGKLAIEYGFPFYVATANILLGWTLAEQGQEEKGIVQIRQGIADYRATGAELIRPHFLGLLAKAYQRQQQSEEGLSALVEALTAVGRSGRYAYEAELCRLKGDLLRRMGE